MKQPVDIRLTRARAQLIQDHAFFGSLAMRLTAVERGDIKTMATDGAFLFYSRKFLDEISERITLFAVAHEVLHCALGHHTRRGNRDPNRWNIACDYVVNWMLKLAGFKVPDWVYINPDYAGMNAEQVYRLLEQQEQKQKSQQQNNKQDQDQPNDSGSSDQNNEDEPDDQDPSSSDAADASDDASDDQSGEGPSTDGNDADADPSNDSGSGGEGQESDQTDTPKYAPSHGDPGRCGEILDAAPQHDQAAMSEAADEWQVFTRQAANVARRRGEGKLPGWIEEIVDVLNTPETDWHAVLRRFVDPTTSTKDFTWSIPNRRFMGMGFYTPGMVSDGVNHIIIFVDTSGSVATEWLAKFGCEAQALLDEGAVDKVTVVFIDTQVNDVREYARGDIIDFTVKGRGGTMFAPAFAWANENVNDISAAVYFTDLECSDFGPEPPYPVLWAVYGDDQRYTKQLIAQVPFGEVVELVE